MIIDHVKIHNFLLFEDVDVEIGEGLFFVTGENRDDVSSISNGAGKSTFCQAIVWCLFGSVLRKNLNLDDLIGDQSEYAYVEVELGELDVRGDSYRVVIGRGRNHPDIGNDIFIEVGGVEKTFHKKKDAQKYIYQLLDISPDIVFQSAYFDKSQKALVELTPAKLRDKVCELLNIDRFDDYLTELRRIRRETKSGIETKQSKIPEVEDRLDDVEQNIDKYQQLIEQFDQKKKKEVESLQGDLQKIKERKERKRQKIEDKHKVQKERDKLVEKKALYEDVNVEFEQKKTEKERCDRKIKTLSNEIADIKSDYESAKDSLKNLRENVTGECQYCGNRLQDSDKLREKTKKFEQESNELYDEMLEIKVEKKELEQKRKKVKKRIDELQDDMQKRNDIVQDLDRLERKLDNYKKIEDELDRLDREVKDKQKEIEEKKKETSDDLCDMLEDAEERKEKLENQLDNLYTVVNSYEDRLGDLDVLEGAIEDIRSSLFNHFIYKLKDLINHNFDEMAGGDYRCHLSVDKQERFRFDFINSAKDTYLPYSAFSEGEAARIKKAVAIALNKLMKVGFIIDDEGLAGLDAQGVDDVTSFLFEEFQDMTAFFISHRSQIKNKCVDGVKNVHIVKEDGISRVEME